MNREYWLCRATDFPSSIAQFGVHALALAYAHDMPGNIYYQRPKILAWTLAGMEFWTTIQHADGSFDEFYPNERGWAGPTGFLLYAMCHSHRLIEEFIPRELNEKLLRAYHKAALFLATTDESGVLANHHAMAILPMVEANSILQDTKIEKAIRAKLDIFFGYCDDEGWCLEYDGADPGYLSATISFIAKIRARYEDDRFLPFLKKWIEFSSYFVYPNGHYAGTIGSRQTLHFYPHGYELLTREIPLAAAVADRMLRGLRDGALVPPEIQGERYFVYRIPEFLLSYIDFGTRPESPPALPYEREPFQTFFPNARIYIEKRNQGYTVVNAAKGGVVKHFDAPAQALRINNCGIIGRLANGAVFTSQWIDPRHQVHTGRREVKIKGNCHRVPTKIFTPLKFIIFRLVMLAFGWHERPAYYLKGLIRKLLMTGNKPMPVQFERTIALSDSSIEISTIIAKSKHVRIESLQVGDEFPARYVPQSRYFQPQELSVRGYTLSKEDIAHLNTHHSIEIVESYRAGADASEFHVKK